MKKQYLIPTMDIVKTRPYVLNGSSPIPDGRSAIDNSSDTPMNASEIGSRGFAGFDDDDE